MEVGAADAGARHGDPDVALVRVPGGPDQLDPVCRHLDAPHRQAPGVIADGTVRGWDGVVVACMQPPIAVPAPRRAAPQRTIGTRRGTVRAVLPPAAGRVSAEEVLPHEQASFGRGRAAGQPRQELDGLGGTDNTRGRGQQGLHVPCLKLSSQRAAQRRGLG